MGKGIYWNIYEDLAIWTIPNSFVEKNVFDYELKELMILIKQKNLEVIIFIYLFKLIYNNVLLFIINYCKQS